MEKMMHEVCLQKKLLHNMVLCDFAPYEDLPKLD